MKKKAFVVCLWMVSCREHGGHSQRPPDPIINQGNTGLVSQERADELQGCIKKELGTTERSIEGFNLYQFFRSCGGQGLEEFRASLKGLVEPSTDGHTFQVK